SLPRASKHPAHGPLYRVGVRPVQNFLDRLTLLAKRYAHARLEQPQSTHEKKGHGNDRKSKDCWTADNARLETAPPDENGVRRDLVGTTWEPRTPIARHFPGSEIGRCTRRHIASLIIRSFAFMWSRPVFRLIRKHHHTPRSEKFFLRGDGEYE